jgi:tetratricopeptide (TPR) repeat protein
VTAQQWRALSLKTSLYRKEIMMIKSFFRHSPAPVKRPFRNNGPFFETIEWISIVIGISGGLVSIFGLVPDRKIVGVALLVFSVIILVFKFRHAEDEKSAAGTSPEPQPILPNLEHHADKNLRMAESFYVQRNYTKALEHYEKAYEKQEEALKAAQGKGKSGDIQKKALADILVSKGVMRLRMAQYEAANNDFTEAESVYGQLSAGERDYALIYHNRGFVFNEQGDYDKALEWYRKALDIDEKVPGKDHPDTATTYNNIALVYKDQGKYEEALEGYRKALDIVKKVLGKDHPHTAATYDNIASVYQAQGKYEEALEELLKAYRIRFRTFGETHQFTKGTRNDMETVYRKTRNPKPFPEWLAEAMRSRNA